MLKQWLAAVGKSDPTNRTPAETGPAKERVNKMRTESQCSQFSEWLETFLNEKGIDREQILTVQGPSGTNYIPVQSLVEAIHAAPDNEQRRIKEFIVRIDFANGNVIHFFNHIAQAIAL